MTLRLTDGGRRSALDVQPAGGDVGGHQHVVPPRLELRQHRHARVLVHIAVDGRRPAGDVTSVDVLRFTCSVRADCQDG